MAKTVLIWFDQDLRIHDQPALMRATEGYDHLICVYCHDPALLSNNRYSVPNLSVNRLRFLEQSLRALDEQLQTYGQRLIICHTSPVAALVDLVNQYQVCAVFRSLSSGFYENRNWQKLQRSVSQVRFECFDSRTLFDQSAIEQLLNNFPKHFTPFRELAQRIPIPPSLPIPDKLPSMPEALKVDESNLLKVFNSAQAEDSQLVFVGGEVAGLSQLQTYFASNHPAHYKEHRDQLDGWSHSSKFSPWLSQGCLSVRQVYSALQAYELQQGANESTYWLYFELLWREFFQWYAWVHGAKLFRFQGVNGPKPLTSFYDQRFRQWCLGNTPFPVVNACMKQLNSTGYLSNRGRQIVASCLVNELSLDWRYGAAYFEQALLDYDVGSNWGNWQYLAGVGADPRGQRHFDLEKQTRLYDPDHVFIDRWQGAKQMGLLDTIDATGWPIVD
jgi:deoxyribodipyrimidine photo-lyase